MSHLKVLSALKDWLVNAVCLSWNDIFRCFEGPYCLHIHGQAVQSE